jgi:hypothetical protein
MTDPTTTNPDDSKVGAELDEAAVATFNALSHLELAPLPYPDADRLVVISHLTPRGSFLYLPRDVADYRSAAAFSMVGGMFQSCRPSARRAKRFACRAVASAGLPSGLGVPLLPDETCSAAARRRHHAGLA